MSKRQNTNFQLFFGDSKLDIETAKKDALVSLSANESIKFSLNSTDYKVNDYLSDESNLPEIKSKITNQQLWSEPMVIDMCEIDCLTTNSKISSEPIEAYQIDSYWMLAQHLLNANYQFVVVFFSFYKRDLSALSKDWQNLFAQNQNKINRQKFLKTNNHIWQFQWLEKLAANKGININSRDIEKLIESQGFDEYRLLHLLEKIDLLKASGTNMSDEDINKISEGTVEHSIFQISEAIINRDFRKSIPRLINFLKDNQSDVISAFALLASQFRRLYRLRLLQQSESSLSAAQKKFRGPQWMLKKNWQLASKLNPASYRMILTFFCFEDLKIKYLGSYGKEELIIFCNKIVLLNPVNFPKTPMVPQ